MNALATVGARMTLIDFTLSNAGPFYTSMGKPSAVKGLKQNHTQKNSNTNRYRYIPIIECLKSS